MTKPIRPNLRRYHHKIFFPENLGQMCLEFFGQVSDIDVTYHAAEQLMEDKRGIIPLPTREELFHHTNTLVEVYEKIDSFGVSESKIQKMLIRIHNLSEDYDYCYVLAREGFIVSAWANDKNDDHRLTDPNDYYKPSDVG